MIQRLTLQRFLSRADQLGKRLCSEVFTCRECGRPVNPLTWICRHCGTGNPVKIRVSPQLLFTAVACEIVLLFLHLPLH